MANAATTRFEPDYAVHPGKTLAETLDASGMPISQLAERSGLARKTISGIIHEREPITPDTALLLEKVFRVPARFWLDLQKNYEEAAARLRERERLTRHLDWIKQESIPVKDLMDRGAIPETRGGMERLSGVLAFFGVASPEEHAVVWQGIREAYAFRKSAKIQSRFGTISAWLRLGEIAAAEISCAAYDKKRFAQALGKIRRLCARPVADVQDDLLHELAVCGIALVLEPGIRGAPIHGATRWLTKDKALVQMSARGKNDGDFWFTLFHELGHIWLHGKRDVFLEMDRTAHTDKEAEANRFARDRLIPEERYHAFLQEKGGIGKAWPLRLSKRDIRVFAASVAISPGIVVGRLQHDGWLPLSHCNDLKQQLRFAGKPEGKKNR